MRIQRGTFKNFDIPCPEGARPSSALLREAYFTIVEQYESRCFVDLFAGSGIMGFEYLSRVPEGRAIFVDSSKAVVRHLMDYGKRLKILDRMEIIQADAMSFKKSFSDIDIIFADPPFPIFNWEKVLQVFDTLIPKERDVIVSVKAPKDSHLPGRIYGDSILKIGYHEANSDISWKF